MRGTPLRGMSSYVRTGIIPAYAGNTYGRYFVVANAEDHPRVCGEHQHGKQRLADYGGSSPRMRGTRARAKAERKRFGIIPAYAGNTTNDYDFDTPRRDHPRVCGEHPSYMSRGRYEVGSSPRMRGTLVFLESSYCPVGIIPAYAGNTPSTSPTVSRRRDHPRVCGEHFNAVRNAASPQGSSPRMRGTPTILPGRHRGHGIIPAYAGNTVTLSAMHEAYWDHPRVCGEHHFSINTPS